MSRYTLWTYEDNDELERYYKHLLKEGRHIQSFLYEFTEDYTEEDDVIDISHIIKQLIVHQDRIPLALYHLRRLCEDYEIIIKSEQANQAMDYFNLIFDKLEPIFEKAAPTIVENNLIPLKRKVLYTYENSHQLDAIIEFADENEVPFTDFSKLNGSDNYNIRLSCDEENKVILDLTNVVKASTKNPEIIYAMDQLLNSFLYYDPIIREDTVNEALDLYPILFSNREPVTELLDGIVFSSSEVDNEMEDETGEKIDTVINLDSIDLIHEALSSQLIGHADFKKEFKNELENFLILNKIGAEKIFSILLLGNSGLGKTEVARIIKRVLNDDTSLVKINFGNYSSDNALNSLMGSSRGYIGSEDGELSLKISKSKAGIILCDEFEKATVPIFNFFLELLEDGVFTDSQSREYDLNGYIIIFTSNMDEDEYEKIPKELQSRFDLVCDFTPLSTKDKIDYVKHQINEFLGTLESNDYHAEISEPDWDYFKKIIESNDNLRDIKRIVHRRILNKLKK